MIELRPLKQLICDEMDCRHIAQFEVIDQHGGNHGDFCAHHAEKLKKELEDDRGEDMGG